MAARPTDDALTVALARVYIRTGHFGKAEGVLTSRLKADPKDAAVSMVLGPLYLATGRTADARKVYDDLLAQKPNDVTGAARPRRCLDRGKEMGGSDRRDQARERGGAPRPRPGVKLVNLYLVRQDWKNATSTASDLAAKFPSNVEVLDAQARAQIGAGDLQSAIATYKRAYQLAPNSTESCRAMFPP